jgi:hypothetical protein
MLFGRGDRLVGQIVSLVNIIGEPEPVAKVFARCQTLI